MKTTPSCRLLMLCVFFSFFLGSSRTFAQEVDVADLLRSNLTGFIHRVNANNDSLDQKNGAVQKLEERDFNEGHIYNPWQLVQGRLPGLTIARPGSNPNASFSVRIRGVHSLTQRTSPLIIVDGLPAANLDAVDPMDIASFEVLKDAGAAAQYGIRGASGVVVIETKKGQSGQTQIQYNGYLSAESATKPIPVFSRSEYINNGGIDFGASTDWMDEITRTALSQGHQLALSGGTDQTTYRIALNYRSGEGILQTTNYQQYSGRLSLQQTAWNDRLELGMNLAAINRNSQLGFDEAFRYGTIYNPTAPIKSSAAEFESFGGYFQQLAFDFINPVALLEQNTKERQYKNYFGRLYGDLAVLPGLHLKLSYHHQQDNWLNGAYYPTNSFFRGQFNNGLAQRQTDETRNDFFQTHLQWEKTFNDFQLRVKGGYQYQHILAEGVRVSAGDFITDAFSYHNLETAQSIANGTAAISSFKNVHEIQAYFAQGKFVFKNLIFLDAGARLEGSSWLGENDKQGLFPNLGLAFNLDEALESTTFDRLMMRGSWGISGNLPNAPHLSQTLIGPVGTIFYNGSFVPGYGLISNGNPDLTWERKTEWDLGVDFALWDNAFSGSIDYFRALSTDLIYEESQDIPLALFPESFVNVGEITGSGIELSLLGRVIRQENLSWSVGMNLAHFKQELRVLNSQRSEERRTILGAPGGSPRVVLLEEGQPLGQIEGAVFDRLDQGIWQFEDINGDGFFCFCQDDHAVIGNGFPDLQMGLSSMVKYKNLDVSFFLRGVFGHSLVNVMRARYETSSNGNPLFNTVVTDYFEEDAQAFPAFSDYYVESGSFLRMENITLGYRFNLKKKSPLSTFRIFVNAMNLFTITGYEGADPDLRLEDAGTTSNGSELFMNPDPLSIGIDRRNTWLPSRAFVFGIRIGG